ncbi:MAG: hypothetical protein KDI29_15240, partial [Pseudomonadales bacterium]|nr:hypothetical protein [Pseudomonadales bacterium]
MNSNKSETRLARFLSVFKYSRVALQIVWSTSATLTVVLAVANLVAGIMPAAIAYVGQFIVDSVVAAVQQTGELRDQARNEVLFYVLLEAGLVV